MSDNALAKINEVLAAYPARDKRCGDKTTVLRREGDTLIADVTFADCARQSRFEVPWDALDVSSMGTDVTPENGRGQVFIPCRDGAGNSRWLTRDDADSDWRQARSDPEFAIDLAPDDDVADEVKGLLQRWLRGE